MNSYNTVIKGASDNIKKFWNNHYHCLANFWVLPTQVGRSCRKCNKAAGGDYMDIFLGKYLHDENFYGQFQENYDGYTRRFPRESFAELHMIEGIYTEKQIVKETKDKGKENSKPSQIRDDLNKTVVLEPLDEHLADEKNADEVVNNVDEHVLTEAIEDEMPMQALTEEEKELFSFFLPIPNMEKTIMSVLTGARERLLKEGVSSRGNIIITGGRGSGKTTLAKALIMTLQNEIDKPGKNIGKIDAEKLNGKDLQELYSRIKGGCLVIEGAGDLLLDTEVSLSLLMDNDTEGTLVILEDNKAGIERAISTYAQFAKKFTERISIPVFRIDELVTFGIKYADDAGYNVDEMGRLAMYDRISKAQRGDRPLYLKDIIEIMDEAIDRSNSKGFFHRKKVDEDGRPMLVEKDFL
jgi:hypothetical protein